MKFHRHIWSHHAKWIEISTNMPGIGSLIREIHVKIEEFEKAKRLLLSITNARLLLKSQLSSARLYGDEHGNAP